MADVNNQTVTPWEVKGNIDYDKLIKEFGTKKISKEMIERIEKYAKKNESTINGVLLEALDTFLRNQK